jgi:hypothetical protein
MTKTGLLVRCNHLTRYQHHQLIMVSLVTHIFASARTIAGDFPPSSRVTSFKFDFAADSCTARPVRVDPVKEIFRIFICLEGCTGVVNHYPLSMLRESYLTLPAICLLDQRQ